MNKKLIRLSKSIVDEKETNALVQVILNDDRPWRTLIHVQDIPRAIDWAIHRKIGENYIVLNTGLNRMEFSSQRH